MGDVNVNFWCQVLQLGFEIPLSQWGGWALSPCCVFVSGCGSNASGFPVLPQLCEQSKTLLVHTKLKYWSLFQTCCGEDLSQPQIHLHTENPPLGCPWQHRLQLAPGMGCLDFLLCQRISKISFGIRIEDKLSNWNKCMLQIWFLPAKVQGDFYYNWSDCDYITSIYF